MRDLGFVREVMLDPDRPEMHPGRDAQHRAINDYAERHGWDIVDVQVVRGNVARDHDIVVARVES